MKLLQKNWLKVGGLVLILVITFISGVFFAIESLSDKQKLTDDKNSGLRILAADDGENKEWAKTLDSVSISSVSNINTPPPQPVESKINIIKPSPVDVSANNAKIREYETLVASLEVQKKTDSEKISQLENSLKSLNTKWALRVQETVNSIAALMVDKNYKGSLYNDIFLNLIPQSPMYYSQEMIDIDKEIGIRTAYQWPSMLCYSLEPYVKAGWLTSKGDECLVIENFSSTLKR